MTKIYQAFTEISYIFNHMNYELINKIPKSFIAFIEKNKDLNYKVNIDLKKYINEQPFLKETKIILALLYRDYICSKEEKNELLRLEKEELEIQEKERIRKYNLKIKEIKNKTLQYSEEKSNTQSIIVINQKNLFDKIKNNIKSFILKVLGKKY